MTDIITLANEIYQTKANIAEAIRAKGVSALTTDAFDTYAAKIGSIPQALPNKVGEIVYDDNNTAIGTISGIKTDSSGVSYAVCCLNGSYRGTGQYHSRNVEITDLPIYGDQKVWENKETATFNTQKVLDYVDSHGTSSAACTLCRAASFVIKGITYYGQLPTIDELVDIFRHRTVINSQDSSGNNPLPTTTDTISSTQYSGSAIWYISTNGSVSAITKGNTSGYFVIPVIEIPVES